MFCSKNKKQVYQPQFFFYIKVGLKGVYIAQTCISDGSTHCHEADIINLKKNAFGVGMFRVK